MARWSGTAVLIVISLVVLTLLGRLGLWAHVWHPVQLLQGDAWLSLAGLGVGVGVNRKPVLRNRDHGSEQEHHDGGGDLGRIAGPGGQRASRRGERSGACPPLPDSHIDPYTPCTRGLRPRSCTTGGETDGVSSRKRHKATAM